MCKVITVVAGKGGTGKTTAVAALSSCLAALGYRVLCTDFDLNMKDLEYMLGMAGSGPTDDYDAHTRRQGSVGKCLEHPRIPNLFYLSSRAYRNAENEWKSDLKPVFDEIRREFDYCLIDAPPVSNPAFGLAHSCADMTIITTSGELPGMSDVRKASTYLFSFGIKEIKLLVNRFHPVNTRLIRVSVAEVIEAADIPLIGIIPEDKIVFQALHSGIPLVLFYKRYSVYHFLDVARRLAGDNVPWRMRLGMSSTLLNPQGSQTPAEPKPVGEEQPQDDHPPMAERDKESDKLLPEARLVIFGNPEEWAKSTLPQGDAGELVKIQDIREGLFTNANTVRNRTWLHDILDDNQIPYRIEIEGYWPGRRKFVESQGVYVEEKNAKKARRLIKEFKRTENILLDESIKETQVLVNEDGMPQKVCPSCGEEIDFDYVTCPHCKTHF